MEQGTVLGSYRIVGRLGEGGMGEVYLAEDTGLRRQVAVKVLPAELASDADRLARMRREAQLLAQLSHPNVAAIHGIESAELRDGSVIRFLVMELAEGTTLADRIAAGPVPVEEAVDIARQIADGLETAHERGIVHRDLKPANVMVDVAPGGAHRVKVLDFGLAKDAAGDVLGKTAKDLSLSPTVALTTGAGVILGTAAYMSPEQARGKPVDRRADIWAFGCVLYEMLTGTMPFRGETVTDLLAAVVKEEPDWALLPTDTPRRVRALLRRCLDKDSRSRLRDIGEARVALESVEGTNDEEIPAAPAPAGLPWRWAIPGAVLVAMAALFAGGLLSPESGEGNAGTLRLTLPLPQESRLPAEFPRIAANAEGTAFAYAAMEGMTARIYVQELGEFEPREVPGTEGGTGPIFSPDGRWIAYFIAESLYRIPVAGGTPQLLSPLAVWDRDALWHPDGQIYLGGDAAASAERGLGALSAEGGPVRRLTEPGPGETAHDGPTLLPDGTVLFAVLRADGRSHLARYWPETGEVRAIDVAGVQGWWVEGGYLLVAEATAQGTMLRAHRFDLSTNRAVAGSEVVLDDVEKHHVTVSPSGTLAYVTREVAGGIVTIVNREGQASPLLADPAPYRWPRMSPDGTRLAIGTRRPDDAMTQVWVHELSSGRRTRLGPSTGRNNTEPVWSPDGREVLMSSQANPKGLVVQRADGSQPPRLLHAPPFDPWPTDWSRDGKTVVFYGASDEDGSNAVWTLDLGGEEPSAIQVAGGPGGQRLASLSPNGRWLAYSSTEDSGQTVFLQPFPERDRRWTVSATGGTDPQWSPDGTELFYRHEDGVYAVGVNAAGGEVELGAPELLFRGAFSFDPNGDQSWDVAPDGRFVMIQPEGRERRELRVIIGIGAELGTRLPN